VADKVLASVAKPVTLHERDVKTTVSIGISFYPDNSGDAEALVRAADYAMYLAKADGKNSWQVCPKGLPGPGKQFRPTPEGVSSSAVAGS
jgi:diguanylate cyclase (GGDEF)-like protein